MRRSGRLALLRVTHRQSGAISGWGAHASRGITGFGTRRAPMLGDLLQRNPNSCLVVQCTRFATHRLSWTISHLTCIRNNHKKILCRCTWSLQRRSGCQRWARPPLMLLARTCRQVARSWTQCSTGEICLPSSGRLHFNYRARLSTWPSATITCTPCRRCCSCTANTACRRW